MGLTSAAASAPFESGPGEFDFEPPKQVRYWEPWPRRMRAVIGRETVLDSRRGVMLWESGSFPELYFPLEDVRADLLNEQQITGSPTAPDGGELLSGYVNVDYAAMDRWFEEDDPIYAHPRDPYHRVDVRSASQHVVVRFGDQVVAESSRPKLLFETGVAIRYYVPFADVRIDLLAESETVSECPYKGDGQHWHLTVGEKRVEDAAWSLPHPLPEGIAAIEHVCFYPDKVEVEVDGERVGA